MTVLMLTHPLKPSEDGRAPVLVVVELPVEGEGQDDAHFARLTRRARPEEGVRASAVVLEALDPVGNGERKWLNPIDDSCHICEPSPGSKVTQVCWCKLEFINDVRIHRI